MADGLSRSVELRRITNEGALLKIANAIAMCAPDDVFVNTGSAADRQSIRELALSKREEASLAMADHTIHFDLKEEQGRIIDRTYYIANEGEQISSLGKRISREEALEAVRDHLARERLSVGGSSGGLHTIVAGCHAGTEVGGEQFGRVEVLCR